METYQTNNSNVGVTACNVTRRDAMPFIAMTEHDTAVRDAQADHRTTDIQRGVAVGSEWDRRRFLRTLAGGTAASVGIAGTASAQETPVVVMGNTYFDPIGLYVEPGTTVRFEIEAGAHSATAYEDRIPAEATPFDSGVMSDGGFEYTFDVPGTHDYYCIPHQSSQVGRIVVGEPGGPAEESTIPHGSVPDSETIVERGSIPVDDVDGAGSGFGGMMGPHGGSMGPGIMGNGSRWAWVLPIGFMTAVLGSIAVLVSRGTGYGTGSSRDDHSAVITLRKRYARGDIDREEFERRRDRLRKRE